MKKRQGASATQKRRGLLFSEAAMIKSLHPLPDFQQTCPAVATAASSSSSSSSLDTQQTSDVFYPAEEWNQDYTPAEKTVSEYVHGGWMGTRAKIWQSFKRTKQSEGREYRFAHCGESGWVYQNLDDLDNYRLVLNRCGDRFCVVCGGFRAAKLRAKVAANTGHGTLRLLTLTVQAKKQKLSDAIKHLYASFRLLRQTNLWEKKVVGGMAFLEIKWNAEKNRWHPHLHIVMEGFYIEQGFVTQFWKAITGDSEIVDVRRIYNPDRVQSYVTKYVTKPMNQTFVNDPTRLDEAVEALKGKRMAIPFGSWYAKKVEELKDEEVRRVKRIDPVWTPIGNIADVLAKAARGDEKARYIIQRLRRFKPHTFEEDSS